MTAGTVTTVKIDEHQRLADLFLRFSTAVPALSYEAVWALPNVVVRGTVALSLRTTVNTRGGTCDYPGCNRMAASRRAYYCSGCLPVVTRERSSRAARAARQQGKLELPLPSGRRAVPSRIRVPVAGFNGQPSGEMVSVPDGEQWSALSPSGNAAGSTFGWPSGGVIRTRAERWAENNVRDESGLTAQEWIEKYADGDWGPGVGA